MQADWDARAREDAQYYVAFGRRSQSAEEFFASAADVLRTLRQELKRFPPGTDPKSLTALEIGCGPGRLMLPLSDTFGQVYGVDVSAEMVELARKNLAGRPNAEPRHASGSDLAGFDDESIDFVYSYAVFQHIPSREVVLSYLAEAVRVLRPGGVLRAQVNSLPRTRERRLPAIPGWSSRAGAPPRTPLEDESPDTWSGVSFEGEEVAQVLDQLGLRLLALDGFETQYLWVTAQKPTAEPAADRGPSRLVGVSNTFTGDRLTPQQGRFASASLWVSNPPEGADLLSLAVEVEGVAVQPVYIGPRTADNAAQVNFFLPPGVRTGAVPVRLTLDGRPVSNAAPMRVTPAAPLIPRLLSVTDGVNLLSDLATDSRTLKVNLEEAPVADGAELAARFEARLDDQLLPVAGVFCVDPLPRRYEINLTIPDSIPAGPYNLFCRLGSRAFPHVGLHVTGS